MRKIVVKKILFILSLFLLTSSAVYSAEEVILEKEGFMQNLIAITEPTITQADIKPETGAVTNYPLTNPDTFHRHFHVYDELARTAPRLVLVAMGAPKQEEFIFGAKKVLKQGLMIGIGGRLDVWSGNIKRAPKIFQTLGLEWLYRTVSQPERFKRIFPALPLFILKALKYKIK